MNSVKKIIIFVTITILAILNFYLYYKYFTGPKFSKVKEKLLNTTKSEPKVEKTPEPVSKWIYPGTETYSISGGKKEEPKITKIVLDPQDPSPQNSQTIKVSVSHTSDIESVMITITSNNSQKNIEATLISGSKQDGVWEAKHIITDGINYKYIVAVTAVSKNNKRFVDLVLR